MLSFKKGKPVATVIGGRLNNEIIFVTDLKEKPQKKCCKRCSKMCARTPCCKNCGGCELGEDVCKDLEVKDGLFEQIPSLEDRVIYIAGPAGSGKSTYSGKYIANYLRIYPHAKFIVFSRLDEDKALDWLKPHRVQITNDLIENPIEIKSEIDQDSIILFDDIDTIQEKKLQLAVNKLKQDILEIGRHYNIRIVVTSHLINPNERASARTLLNEMNTLTIFPKSGSSYQIEYALKRYFGLSAKAIKEILAMPSRWVTLFKGYPQLALSEHRCVLLSEL